jgi:CotH kinase protein
VAGDDAPTNLLAMGKEDDWILNGQYVDRALYRNRFAYDVFQSLGDLRVATDLRFCEMTLDGQYVGVYTLGERLDRDDDRIDIGSDDSFIVKLDDEEGFLPTTVGYGLWELEYPDEDDGNVAATLQGFEAAVRDGGRIFDWVDLDSAVDWVLLQELLGNHDAYLLSVHLWKDEDGPMFFAPWDMDLSMGYPLPDCDAQGWNPRQFTTYYGDLVDAQFVEAFAADPAFHEALVARWRDLREAQLADEVLFRRVDSYAATLGPAIDANSARWPVDEISFPVQYVETLCPAGSWAEEHARTKTWLAERLAWMDANIETF